MGKNIFDYFENSVLTGVPDNENIFLILQPERIDIHTLWIRNTNPRRFNLWYPPTIFLQLFCVNLA